ncbi:hypothetical protein HJC99_05460 [Candidatus Saccharibacteria bacterium]|nr:hypothetical protein [Candidatus Saccharibacteria bacterium]
MTPNFIRQDDSPLFPAILFNRPVTRGGAGRLLIAGGHTGELSQPTALFALAGAAGAGECLVALPDALLKLLAGTPSTTFVASSPSGSLGREALGRLLELSEDMEAVALGVSLSSNSETAILIDRFIGETVRPVIAFDEAITLSLSNPHTLLKSADNLLVLTMPQVFKLADQLGVAVQIRPGGGLINKLEIVASVSAQMAASMLVYGTEIIIAVPGQPLIVTPTDYRLSLYPAAYYALASVFWMQNPARRREGLATGAFILGQISRHIQTDKRFTISDLGRLIKAELETRSGF